jgi:hypothetical protein
MAHSNHEPKKVIELMELGYELQYVNLVKDKKVVGLACMNYD